MIKNTQPIQKMALKGKERTRQGQSTNEVADLNQNISVIALNVNGLNVPVKRQRSLEWFLKTYFLECIVSVKRMVELILE